MNKRIFLVKSKESHRCPSCNDHLSGYDHRKRKLILDTGETQWYLLRRLKCKSCGSLHIELLDIMQPFKHYSSQTIESELDGTSVDCPAENSTINTWKRQIKDNLHQINGALKAVWMKYHNEDLSILSHDSLLESIKATGSGWLTNVTQMLLKSGLRLPTLFAFSP